MPATTPDERWIAFASDVSGIMEIYVRPLSGEGPTIAVSSGGGVEPRWSRTGDELFFRNGPTIMAARVRLRPDPPRGSHRPSVRARCILSRS